MTIKAIVAKISSDHLAAYAAGAVNPPRAYFKDILVPIPTEEALQEKILEEAPSYDSSSTITRNFLLIVHQLTKLTLFPKDEKQFDDAQQKIAVSKVTILKQIAPAWYTKWNPFGGVVKQETPFDGTFVEIEKEFARIKALKLVKQQTTPKASLGGADVKQADAAPLTDAALVVPSVSVQDAQLAELKKQLAELKSTNEDLKKAVKLRFQAMARIDKFLKEKSIKFKAVFDEKLRVLNIFPESHKLDIERLTAIKKAVDNAMFTFLGFFKGNLFHRALQGQIVLPNYASEKEKMRVALSLCEAVTYKKTGRNLSDEKANANATAESLANEIFNQIDAALDAHLKPGIDGACEVNLLRGKMGELNEAFWTSLQEDAKSQFGHSFNTFKAEAAPKVDLAAVASLAPAAALVPAAPGK